MSLAKCEARMEWTSPHKARERRIRIVFMSFRCGEIGFGYTENG